MTEIDHKKQRSEDSSKVLDSSHPRKVVVAGPGTGKSFLFQEAIRKKKEEGKSKFLAITFIGKLCDELADDLAGLAPARTLHGFAKDLVQRHSFSTTRLEYYPKIKDVITEDLGMKDITDFEVGDENYKNRTIYYNAVGDDDVVHYAVEICKEDSSKIPQYDLILIDEFQDFNEKEAEFIDLLATKNEMLVVGDDDQALYEFKGSYSKFIKDKYDASNTDFESHTLKYCSRCPQVIIDAFHNIVNHYTKEGELVGRINKEYVCYTPDKEFDSSLNQKIHLLENVPIGMIATKIKNELQSMVDAQKVKSVLIVGESRTCKKILASVARGLHKFGFKNVKHQDIHPNIFTFDNQTLSAYKILSRDPDNTLAWRLLVRKIDDQEERDIILKGFEDPEIFINSMPEDFKKKHIFVANVLKRILTESDSKIKGIANSSVKKLTEEIVEKKEGERAILIHQLIKDNKYISRPLANLEITVCNILGSKGLGADVVFLIGFDDGKLPMSNDKVESSEIYQMLVALTRAKKRMYLINTVGRPVSSFSNVIESFLERIKVT